MIVSGVQAGKVVPVERVGEQNEGEDDTAESPAT
jgi:hypothetical protein